MMHIANTEILYLSDTNCLRKRKNMWYALYQQMLEAGKHYVLVKEVFFDLLKKKKELDISTEKYEKGDAHLC